MSTSDWAATVIAAQHVFSRSPSAHNTQPWVLRRREAELVLGWDRDRELLVGDPTRRDLWLSLGAFVESVLIAAASVGAPAEVRWQDPVSSDEVAVLRQAASDVPPPAFTAQQLRDRRTARGPYAEPAVTTTELAAVADAAGLPDGVTLRLLDPELVDELLPVADRFSYGTPAQVAELRQWTRLRRRAANYRQDGLTDRALGLGRGQAWGLRVALSPRVWNLLRRFGGPRLLAASSATAGRGAVAAMSVPADLVLRPSVVGECGQALLRTWLSAAAVDLSVHPLSVLVDCPATAHRLQLAHGGSRVLAVFRIGRPVTNPVRSARLGSVPGLAG